MAFLSPFPFLLIDLTHTLQPAIPTWEGDCGYHLTTTTLPAPEAGGVDFHVQELRLHAGVGTHLDAPSHCAGVGKAASIADLPLEHLAAPCCMINVAAKAHATSVICVSDIVAWEEEHGTIPAGSVVIINTGWSKRFGNAQEYRNNYAFPTLSAEAAELLRSRQIVGLGIDTLGPDRPERGFHTHRILLGAGIYLLENVANADQLPATGAYVMALPLKIAHGTEAPLRLVGLVPRT